MTNETVPVCIDVDAEATNELVIARTETQGLDIPVALYDALTAADDAKTAAETTIMEYVAQHYPEAGDVVEWVWHRANDAKHDAAVAAHAAAHPGQSWLGITTNQRLQWLDAAGYQIPWSVTMRQVRALAVKSRR